MKSYYYIALIWMGFLFTSALHADGLFDSEEIRIRYEDNLERQLDRSLLSVMPPNSFDVMVNVKLGVQNTKNQTEQVIQKKTSEKSGPKFTKTAPGFDPTLVESANSDEDVDLKESFGFDKEIVVKRVLVVLILHKFLSEEKKELAKGIISDKVKSVYGTLANLVVRESEFVTFHTPTFSSQVKNFFYYHATTLLYYILGLFALIFLFSLIKMMSPKKQIREMKKAMKMMASKSTIEANEDKQKEEADRKEAEACMLSLVDAIQKDPTLLKDLLIDLPEFEAAVFASIVEKTALRGPIKELLGDLPIAESQDFSEEEMAAVLRKIASSLSHYVRLRSVSQDVPFWYLKSMDLVDVVQILGNDVVEYLAIVLQYLPTSRTQEFLSLLSADTKAKLVEKVAQPAFLHSLASMERDVDKKINTYAKLAQIRKKGKSENQLLTQVLDYDATLEETMKALKERGLLAQDKRFKKYFATFEDFMKEEATVISRCVKELDNRNFAVLLKGLDKEKQAKLLMGIPALRKNILRDEMAVAENSEIEKTSAMQTVMRAYRNAIKG